MLQPKQFLSKEKLSDFSSIPKKLEGQRDSVLLEIDSLCSFTLY